MLIKKNGELTKRLRRSYETRRKLSLIFDRSRTRSNSVKCVFVRLLTKEAKDQCARHSSTLRGAEVIFTVSFLPLHRVPFLLCTGSCGAIVTLSSLSNQRSPLGNRQSDQPKPLQSTEPDHKYLARDRSFDYQSCIYSNGPNPSRTLLQDCHVATVRSSPIAHIFADHTRPFVHSLKRSHAFTKQFRKWIKKLLKSKNTDILKCHM